MKVLSRESILGATDRQTETVHVPEWGGSVMVRTITAGERDRWELSVQGSAVKDVRASLVALTVCDENGKLLFGSEDIPMLSEKASSPMQRVFDVAVRINGVSKSDVEELEKN